MNAEQLAGFRETQSRFRQPLVVPTVLFAVALTCGFLIWDLLREAQPWSWCAQVRLIGAAAVLGVLALVRFGLKLPLRGQAITLYVAVYLWQLGIGHALGENARDQLPGLLIVMYGAILALPRSQDSFINAPLAVLSLPVILAPHPSAAQVFYVIGHFATVVVVVWMACAILERLFAQNYLFYQRLQREARTDMLTGLANRREFERQMTVDLERARRLRLPLTLAILDIDHFKAVNDAHGHHAGDRVLKEVASELRRCVRDSDLLARLGGEEFAVVLMGSTAAEAHVLLERLRTSTEALPLSVGAPHCHCTISIGAAQTAEDCAGWEQLYERADAALYEAKASGRNRTVLAGDQAAPGLHPLAPMAAAH